MSAIDDLRRQAKNDRDWVRRNPDSGRGPIGLYSLEEVEALLAEIDRLQTVIVERDGLLFAAQLAKKEAQDAAIEAERRTASARRDVPHLSRLIDEMRTEGEIMADALRHIAGERCVTFTGNSNCRQPSSGRRRDGYYGADRWCDQCIALDALERLPVDNFSPDGNSLHDATSNNPVDNSGDPFTKMDIPGEIISVQRGDSWVVTLPAEDGRGAVGAAQIEMIFKWCDGERLRHPLIIFGGSVTVLKEQS